MNNKDLINLLEEEMKSTIVSINVKPEDEDNITIENVDEWYRESEKIIRVLANILTVPMFQAINQLRYAGHHILKSKNNNEKINLIEAYKHCKRSIFDSLDFYVYKLNEIYRVEMPLLDSQKAIKLEGLLKEHIIKINICREECENRVNYYDGVQKTLIDGLKLIENINEIQRETGIAKELRKDKTSLIDENSILKNDINTIKSENVELQQTIRDKYNKKATVIAILITLCVIITTVFTKALIVSKHEITYTPFNSTHQSTTNKK